MTLDELRDRINQQTQDHARTVAAMLEAFMIGQIVTVKAGGNLQAALDKGGAIQLEAGATYEAQGFVIRAPNTQLIGNGATLRGTSKPALTLLPGVHDTQLSELFGKSDTDAVFQFGTNDEQQTSLSAVPRRLLLHRVDVYGHRRKRGFSLHAADVVMEDCRALDIYDVSASTADSQGLYIHNTPGPVTVVDTELSAGSEPFLLGGDTPRIPGIIPANVNFQRCKFFRPLSWQTDGVKRKVKTLFELKTGEKIRVENSTFDGCWKDNQQGFAITITPRLGGGIREVTFDNCRLRNVGGGVNILGENDAADQGPTPFRTSGVVFRGGSAVIEKAKFGGYGCLALCQHGVESLTFDNLVCVHDGGKLIDIADAVPHGELNVWDSLLTAGTYSISINGEHNLLTPLYDPALPDKGGVKVLKLSGLTFADAASSLKKNYPEGRYITKAELLALPLVQERLT